VRQFDYLVQAIRLAGPRKLLFGSDGPWLHPGVELHKIRLLGLPEEQEDLVLGGNALRLLRSADTRKGVPRTNARREPRKDEIAAAYQRFASTSEFHSEASEEEAEYKL